MSKRLHQWALLCLANLFVVSILGVLLRYKGAFSFPLVNYKFLLNAHSHFAFSGWVTTALFTSLVYILSGSGRPLSRQYRYQFWLNQVSSYGMLVSFTIQGYGPASIFFSTLSILVSYWFAIRYWKDSQTASWSPSTLLGVRLAILFLVLSSAGPFLLAYSMSHAVRDNNFYFNAIYLYLHFQYNGWFSFAILALFSWASIRFGIPLDEKKNGRFITLMGAACIPAYGLSLLWTDPPAWVWVLSGLAAISQLAALFILFRNLPSWRSSSVQNRVRILWALALAAFSIKLILQACSVIPFLGQLAFGHRPVVIAYLHLVLLGFAAFFLVGFFFATGLIRINTSIGRVGLACFIAGVFANEVFLLVQSVCAFAAHSWKSAPGFLFGAAILLFAGLGMLLSGALHSSSPAREEGEEKKYRTNTNGAAYPAVPGPV